VLPFTFCPLCSFFSFFLTLSSSSVLFVLSIPSHRFVRVSQSTNDFLTARPLPPLSLELVQLALYKYLDSRCAPLHRPSPVCARAAPASLAL
jgi:hypothetical protein